MAFDRSVNTQITDAVTQTNVKVISDAPAMALPAEQVAALMAQMQHMQQTQQTQMLPSVDLASIYTGTTANPLQPQEPNTDLANLLARLQAAVADKPTE